MISLSGGGSEWLSPQALIDCAPRVSGTFENQSVVCNGGCLGNICLDQPGEMIIRGGIPTERAYPYAHTGARARE